MSQSCQLGSTLKDVIKTYSIAKMKWAIICQYVQNSLCAGRPHTHRLTSDPKGSTNFKHVTMIHASKRHTCDVLNESNHRRNLLQEYFLCYQRKIPIDLPPSGICCFTKSNIPGQGQAGSGPEGVSWVFTQSVPTIPLGPTLRARPCRGWREFLQLGRGIKVTLLFARQSISKRKVINLSRSYSPCLFPATWRKTQSIRAMQCDLSSRGLEASFPVWLWRDCNEPELSLPGHALQKPDKTKTDVQHRGVQVPSMCKPSLILNVCEMHSDLT